ncbi:9803_t:CDS:1, partial [Scutellospora calospora]
GILSDFKCGPCFYGLYIGYLNNKLYKCRCYYDTENPKYEIPIRSMSSFVGKFSKYSIE